MTRNVAHHVDIAEHRAPKRLIGKGRHLKPVEHQIVGRVVGLSDFLQDDRAFAGKFLIVEGGVLQDIGEDIDGERHIFLQDPGVIDGAFPAV